MWIDKNIFNQQVQKHFMFLQSEYNMSVAETRHDECFTFESDAACVNIWFDKYSLDVIMRTKNGSFELSLRDVLHYQTGSSRDAEYMATNEEKLDKGLQKLSGFVKLYCHEALSGNVEFYKKIAEHKEKFKKEYAFRNMVSSIEERAKVAWERKDYKQVIEIYGSVIGYLTPVQEKRLNYAKKANRME